MSLTSTESVSELEELLDNEIPCGGSLWPPKSCSHAATLRSTGHGCRPWFKCIACWQFWYCYAVEYLAVSGPIPCKYCGGRFATVEAFSDYRPF